MTLPQSALALGYLAGLLGWLAAVGGGAAFLRWLRGEAEPVRAGVRRWLGFNTDHKTIGVQYLAAALLIFVLAGLMALLMRAELARPGLQLLDHRQYNAVMTLHGIGMILVALIAIVGGLGNFVLPLQLGAADMAFPRLNALSFWLLPPAVVLLGLTPLFGGADAGWTGYAPLSTRGPAANLLYLLAFVTAGFSSIFGGVNFFATIATMRAKGMTAWRIPVFAWSLLATAMIILFATSVVAASLLMAVSDRVLKTAFFDASRGGDALLYQHLFWFYSHPAVYIMILPAFGVVLEILPVFARRPLFAYRLAAVSFLAIAALSFVVWAHHLFTSGMWAALSIPFMVTTELISVPTGVVFLAALGTLWGGRIRLEPPMLFALGMLANFLIGGLTGIFLADVPTDLHLQDTWFVMAHFHYTIVGGTVFAFFAGLYHWYPKMTGRLPNPRLARLHFWLFFVGFNLTFLPMFRLGSLGMRRRVADYPAELGNTQWWITVMAWIVAAGVLVGLVNLVRSLRAGRPAGDDPWEARTLEWRTASPPPHGNFASPPDGSADPYGYGAA
jgi:cytochrome c oxidase subunit 1